MSKRSHRTVGVLIVAALGVLGCGGTTPTNVDVDTTPPAAVIGLQSTARVSSNATVTLRWKQSPELDLAGYNVYRSANGGTASLVSTGASAGFVDHSVSSGLSYVYQVAAFDVSANEGPRVAVRVDVSQHTRGGQRQRDGM